MPIMAETKARFLATKSGRVHVVTTPAADNKKTCPIVKKGHKDGTWKGRRSLSPDAALAMDDCTKCESHGIAAKAKRAALTPEQRRAEANDVRDQTMANASGKKKGKSKARKAAEKTPKQPRDRKPTKSGPRSVSTGSGDPGEDKAKQIMAFGDEHGWSSNLEKEGATGWKVTATRGEETIFVWYVDGKYDTSHHAELHVGGWSGRLRGAHGARRQMSMEGRDRPYANPGVGRSGPRKGKAAEADPPEDESPEDAAARRPFLLDDDELVIIDALKGRTIRWRNGISKSVEEAVVADKMIKVSEHPKTGDRMLDFHELVGSDKEGAVLGPNRVVRLAAIIRVSG
jgi:hypothetical protein